MSNKTDFFVLFLMQSLSTWPRLHSNCRYRVLDFYRHVPSCWVSKNLLTLAGELESLASIPDLSGPSIL